MDIQHWLETEFKPWQEAMKQRDEERKNYATLVKKNARSIKHVVALIHAGSSQEAAAAWNALGFPVELQEIKLTQGGEWLDITTTSGDTTSIAFDDLIRVLNELLSVKA